LATFLRRVIGSEDQFALPLRRLGMGSWVPALWSPLVSDLMLNVRRHTVAGSRPTNTDTFHRLCCRAKANSTPIEAAMIFIIPIPRHL